MEPGSENSILQTRVSETESSWIPITPAKPGFTEQQSICTGKQVEWINLQEFPPRTETEGYQANGSESGKFNVIFQQENPHSFVCFFFFFW